MVVIEGPNLGFLTDTMVWATSRIRLALIAINAQRVILGLPHLYLYADKIFRTDNLMIAAYSARWGFVQPWMDHLNRLMSKLRSSVEWSFGKIKYLFKAINFQMAQRVQVIGAPQVDFILAAFFSNCRTCLQWDGAFRTTFAVVPPSLDDYLGQ